MSIPQFVINHVKEKREDFQALILTLKDNKAQLNEVERFAGLPETQFYGFDTSVAVDVSEAKPEGYAHRETEMTTAETKKKFGYLTLLKGQTRLEEVAHIHLTMPEVNKCHLSRSLGKSSNWFSGQVNLAKAKGLI